MNLTGIQLRKIAGALSLRTVGDGYRTADWEAILMMANYAGLNVELDVDRHIRNHRRFSGVSGYHFRIPPIEDRRSMLSDLDRMQLELNPDSSPENLKAFESDLARVIAVLDD